VGEILVQYGLPLPRASGRSDERCIPAANGLGSVFRITTNGIVTSLL
jgi:hypothetical protein